jgi:hypothetical protein
MLMTTFSWKPAPRGRDTVLGGPALLRDSGGSHYNMTGALIQRSDDGGRTWSEPWELRVEVAYRGRVAVQSKIVERSLDRLLLPVYGEMRPKERDISMLAESRDEGRTWQYVSVIAGRPAGEFEHTEACMIETPSGDLVACVRTSDPSQALRVARSSDEGATWSVEVHPHLAGHPHKVLRLADGNALVVYGHRLEPERGIRAVVLNPEADDVASAEEFVIRNDGAHNDIGYPDAASLENGNVLVVYYWRDGDTCRIERTELACG